MTEKLCSCCLRSGPLDENAFLDEKNKYGPGLCETCKTFSSGLRMALYYIKWNIVPFWLKEHRDDICKVLFAEIGERQ